MKKILLIFLIVSILFSLKIVPAEAKSGQDFVNDLRQGSENVGAKGFGETGGSSQLTYRIGTWIQIVLGTLGIIVVVIILYAGFLWMTAGGNTDQVGKAKSLLINGAIGLLIAISAYAITDFVLDRFVEDAQVQER